MTLEFKYHAPIKYVLGGFLCFVIVSIFWYATVNAFKEGQVWFPVFTLVFGAVISLIGFQLLKLFFQNSTNKKIILGEDFIELPGRKVERTRLLLTEIKEISELNTYDDVLILETKEKTYLIYRNWMKQKDFELIRRALREFWLTK